MFRKNNEAFWQTEIQKGQTTQNKCLRIFYPTDLMCSVREMLDDFNNFLAPKNMRSK